MAEIPEEAVHAAAGAMLQARHSGRPQVGYMELARVALDVVQPLLDELRERAETAEAAIARVRALHKPFQRRDRVAYCDHCSVSSGSEWRRYVLVEWPCGTLAALDGTKPEHE